jgi:hypothetical protein
MDFIENEEIIFLKELAKLRQTCFWGTDSTILQGPLFGYNQG